MGEHDKKMIVIMSLEPASEAIEITVDGIKRQIVVWWVISITGDKTRLKDLLLQSMKGIDRTIPSQNTKNKLRILRTKTGESKIG